MTVGRAIFSGMGITDDPNVDDYYTKARGFPITYSPDDDPEVVDEMRIAAAELKKGGDDSEDEIIAGSTEESSSEDSDDGAVEDWVDEDEEDPTISQAKRKRKIFLSVDKVRAIIRSLLKILSWTQTFPQLHAIVVDILRSEIKRKKIRCLIRKLCATKNRHPVPIRSMKIRWNTTHAEIVRGLDLKPVCCILVAANSELICLSRLSISGLTRWIKAFQERLRQPQNVIRRSGG
jgi:hypothetical protein